MLLLFTSAKKVPHLDGGFKAEVVVARADALAFLYVVKPMDTDASNTKVRQDGIRSEYRGRYDEHTNSGPRSPPRKRNHGLHWFDACG